jgi:hypothetical protein
MAVARRAVHLAMVEVVVVAVVDLRLVASRAEVVPGGEELEAVDVVAVAATNVVAVHLALHERAVDIDLLENLAVGVVETVVQCSG